MMNDEGSRACNGTFSVSNEIVRLNVGGEIFTTTRATLLRYPDSMLGAMFSGSLATGVDENGCYFIDRDGSIFRHVLNFLRCGRLVVPADFQQFDLLAAEADFYQLEGLIEAISQLRSSRGGSFIEVIEVRVGPTATMPTNNSRDKTILSCRRDVINTLPGHFFSPVAERFLQTPASRSFIDASSGSGGGTVSDTADLDFVELELVGSNIRLKLGEYLRQAGWTLCHSDMTSSCGFDSRQSPVYNPKSDLLVIEHSFRDRWYRSPLTL
jgi:hypothetical protein